jgi:succinoglycan biosynthesis protein ExoA
MPPTVSIIVPCYNEEETIGSLLSAILAQTYPREQLEVVIADGFSGDRTREVITRFGAEHPDLALRVVDNLRRSIPAGLNLAIGEARGEIIVRLDAHSVPIPEYVERCVEAIERKKGTNVGGLWNIRAGSPNWIGRGIAAAARHPLGVGDALYRLGAAEGPVDTVPFGAFRRSLIAAIGGFDEGLLTNEDYEFNARIRRSGGVVWLDPTIRSTYIARPSLPALARQYWRYGFWKCRMLLRYPETIRWRQALPPLFVLSVLAMLVAATVWPPARSLLAGAVGLYAAVLLAGGVHIGLMGRSASLIPGSILALATMHTAWGCGFLWSLATARAGIHG